MKPIRYWTGCGVTAYSWEDALDLVQAAYPAISSEEVVKVIENVDIQTLDQKHVVPNMGVPVERGIWYPHQ